ncbi:MAG TPA: magnesium transporter CorA family protein [Polyangiaceae bacterium]|jgi:magnesium transporter|nr:magnesium transporter CorA family protein [Polyangiaceae bacterium]
MIRSYPHAEPPWQGAIWLDLCNASDDERARVERISGLRVPTKAEISEIESSSRVFTESDAMYLSSPLPASGDAREPLTAVGFVLTKKLLLSVRFADNPVFESLYASCVRSGPHSACDVFLRILEALVDRSADTLEHTSAELDTLSHRAFHAESSHKRKMKEQSEALRRTLRKLGQMADWISQIRDTLLGLGRIAAFVSETGEALLEKNDVPRLKAIRSDITSLNDYQLHLSGKVQFLLDATLGFINIEQNDIVKILTIVSVVGVPPVLIAGIYGMNFHVMPELSWPLGYPFAIALMIVAGLAPLAWFKWRGWM